MNIYWFKRKGKWKNEKSTHSGAKYPVVPKTRVEIRPLILSEAILANPKSETLALKF